MGLSSDVSFEKIEKPSVDDGEPVTTEISFSDFVRELSDALGARVVVIDIDEEQPEEQTFERDLTLEERVKQAESDLSLVEDNVSGISGALESVRQSLMLSLVAQQSMLGMIERLSKDVIDLQRRAAQ